MTIEVRPLGPGDHDWVCDFLLTQFGSLRVVTRGRMHHADQLPGFLAVLDGDQAALLTYRVDGGEMEVITLHAAVQGRGLGASLLETAREEARRLGCTRYWLITTNDNEPAQQFYARRGMRLVAVHKDAVMESRKIKPEIPLAGVNGIPIRDEVEFEFRF
jgi:ribosomal protein S18 acetylase RimI-like enzyme